MNHNLTNHQEDKEINKHHNKIGIMGGTFDPIHNGHINCAVHIANWLKLTEIRLLPCHIPPHKNQTSATSQDRKTMVDLACKNSETLTLDERELNKTSTSYTVETLRGYQQEFPDSTLYFIIGMDSLNNFTQWYGWQEILTLCHIVVCSRPGYYLQLAAEGKGPHPLEANISADISQSTIQKSGLILISPENNKDISSTDIRSLIKTSADVQHLLPKNVFHYINEKQLYR